MSDLENIGRAIKNYWMPPVRGLHSKKRRIREKAWKSDANTVRRELSKPSKLIDLVSKDYVGLGGYISFPIGSA